jgi:hypothetical protein
MLGNHQLLHPALRILPLLGRQAPLSSMSSMPYCAIDCRGLCVQGFRVAHAPVQGLAGLGVHLVVPPAPLLEPAPLLRLHLLVLAAIVRPATPTHQQSDRAPAPMTVSCDVPRLPAAKQDPDHRDWPRHQFSAAKDLQHSVTTIRHGTKRRNREQQLPAGTGPLR